MNTFFEKQRRKNQGAHHDGRDQVKIFINYLKEELLQTWDAFLIPDYHRTVFLNCIHGLTPNQYSPIIAKEIEDLQQEQAPIQNTVRAIIARESCISQIRELDKILSEGGNQQVIEECVNILHSLRMLSLHAVKCIIEWRKQLIYSYLLSSTNQGFQKDQHMRKYKNIPFLWEGENYLIKMKADTLFLAHSYFSRYFNFSPKSDPFLVFPSLKSHQSSAAGSGASALKRLKGQNAVKKSKFPSKMTVPLANSLMKMIRQHEVYLMEEAVTTQIIQTAQHGNEEAVEQENQNQNREIRIHTASKGMRRYPQQQEQHKEQKNDQDIVNIKTYITAEQNHNKQNVIQGEPLQELQGNQFQVPEKISPNKGPQQEKHEAPSQGLSSQPSQAALSPTDYHISGIKVKECDLLSELSAYYSKLPKAIAASFPGPESLVQQAQSGYDAHFLYLYKQSPKKNLRGLPQEALGLLVFNVDTMMQRQTQKVTKVNLFHVSAREEERIGEVVDAALKFVWTMMHCEVVRISLYHFEQDGKLAVNPKLKAMLKEKGFKWKTIMNDTNTHSRIELLECPNTSYQSQVDPLTATIFRKGLLPSDIHKEPLTFQISSALSLTHDPKPGHSPAEGQVQSHCGLLNNLIAFKKRNLPGKRKKLSEFLQCGLGPLVGKTEALFEEFRQKREGSTEFRFPEMEIVEGTSKESQEAIQAEYQFSTPASFPSSTFASKCQLSLRFTALDQAQLCRHSRQLRYLRIRNESITFAHSELFEHIIILPSTEGSLNFVILQPKDFSAISQQNMHQCVSQAINNVQERDESWTVIKNIWVPQFKIEASTKVACGLDWKIGEVEENGETKPVHVAEIVQKSNIELFAPPVSEGNLFIEPNYPSVESNFVVDKPFYVAISHTHFEETLEIPYIVGFVNEKDWKSA